MATEIEAAVVGGKAEGSLRELGGVVEVTVAIVVLGKTNSFLEDFAEGEGDGERDIEGEADKILRLLFLPIKLLARI